MRNWPSLPVAPWTTTSVISSNRIAIASALGLEECCVLPVASCLLLSGGLSYEPVACHYYALVAALADLLPGIVSHGGEGELAALDGDEFRLGPNLLADGSGCEMGDVEPDAHSGLARA